MHFLVTGANGLVGSRLCRRLAARGHRVTGVGRGPQRGTGEFDYQTCELTVSADVALLLQTVRPNIVIHTASMTEVDGCERDPAAAFAANALAASYVARGVQETNSHLVHVSTDYVFDGDKGPYGEDDLPNPRGVYSITKHMGEEAVRVFAPNSAIARTAVVYGWPAAGRPNFGAWLVGALRDGKKVNLFEDQFVSPTLADNLAELLVEMGERKVSGTWNTAGATVVNRVQFAEALCEVFGFDRTLLVSTKMADAKLPSPRPARSGLRMDKVQAQLTAKALALPEALARFHAEYVGATVPMSAGR
jgi:dTDP-4-dehydrorhamnose reductase